MSVRHTTEPGISYAVILFQAEASPADIEAVIGAVRELPSVIDVASVLPGDDDLVTPGMEDGPPHAIVSSAHPGALLDVLKATFHPARCPCVSRVGRWVGAGGRVSG